METRGDETLSSAILETVQLPLLALDADLRVEIANDAFVTHFRVSRNETIGRLIYDLGNGQWNIPELRRLLGDILPHKTVVTDYFVEHDFEQIGRRIMRLNARRIVRPDGHDMILLAVVDDTEREALKKELVGRVEMADKLIESVREGLLILEPDLRIHSASKSFYDTFDVDRDETEGQMIYDLGNGQWDIPELRQLLETVLTKQKNFNDYEVSHRFENIGERVMVLNGRRLDHMDLILLAIRDVTEAHQSAARLKEVASAANIGLFEADLKAGTLYWSREMREILGFPQDAPAPPPGEVPDFVYPDDRAAMEDMIQRIRDPEGDGAVVHEHRIIRPDGEVRWVRLHAKSEWVWEDGERRFLRLRGVAIDVTDTKQAEEKLRKSEERYRLLFDSIDEGFCVIEVLFDENDRPVDYEFRAVNAAFERQTGLKDVVGRRMSDLAADHEQEWYDIYGRVATTRTSVRFEKAARALERHFEVFAFPFGAPQERNVGVLFNEISERKQAEKHQHILMAELDHRVKNILAVVQSITRQTLGRGEADDAAEQLVGRIDALARSHALLAQSRWEGARFGEIVETAVEPYRDGRPDRIVAGGSDLKVAPKAAQTLNLAFHELVTNAAKYGALSREAGRVTATWHLTGDRVDPHLVFVWQEQGGPKIEGPPDRKGFGSRLIEQTLAFELDGKVTLDFAPDGLRAVIDLPARALRVAEHGRRVSQPRPEKKVAARDRAVLRGKRTLVVEDEHLVAQETVETLSSAGCTVVGPVSSVPQALGIAVSEDLDAAILDVNLKGDLVWPVARALQARGIPFVFTTGYADTLDAPPELEYAERVAKPVDRRRLLSSLGASLARAI